MKSDTYIIRTEGGIPEVASIIQRMKAEFIMTTGKEATDVYVGEKEMATLVRELLCNTPHIDNTTQVEIESVCGLTLHRVKDKTHLGVGLDFLELKNKS